MDSSSSNFMKGIPSLTSEKKLFTDINPLRGNNSATNPMHHQEHHQQQQQPHQQLMGPMSNMALAPNPHQQQFMGQNHNLLQNSMNNPAMHHMVGPAHNPMWQQMKKSEGNSIFSASDDNVIMQQVTGTHLPDGTDVDVKPLLNIVEDILRHSTINADPISSVLPHNLHMTIPSIHVMLNCMVHHT